MDDDAFEALIRERLLSCASPPAEDADGEQEVEDAEDAEEREDAEDDDERVTMNDPSTWVALQAMLRTMVCNEVARQFARQRRREEDIARALRVFKAQEALITATRRQILPTITPDAVPLEPTRAATALVPAPVSVPAPVPAPAPAKACVPPPDPDPTPSLTLREQAKLRSVADSGKYALVHEAAVAIATAHMKFTRPRKFQDSSGAGITGRINRRR